MIFGLHSPFSKYQNQEYDLSKIIRPDEQIELNLETLRRFLENNVICYKNNLAYLEYLTSLNINVFEHLHKNAERLDKLETSRVVFAQYENGMEYLSKYFLNVQGSLGILDPIWSIYKAKFEDKLFNANYILEDESKDIHEQNEIIIYGLVKIVKTAPDGYLKYYAKHGERWLEFTDFHEKNLSLLSTSLRSKSFYMRNDWLYTDELLNLLSRIVIAEMFNQPEFIYQGVQIPYHDSSKGRYEDHALLGKLHHLFIKLFEKLGIDYAARVSDSQAYISRFHFANSLRKVRWVMSGMLHPDVVRLFSYLPTHSDVNLDNHNKLLDKILPCREALNTWQADNPNKLLLLTNLRHDCDLSHVNDPAALSYENILLKHQNSHHNNVVFFDKRCYQHCLTKVKKKLLTDLLAFSRVASYDHPTHLFTIWTYYFAYSKHKKFNTHVLSTMMFEMRHTLACKYLSGLDGNSKIFRDTLNQIVIAFDVLYECLLQAWTATKKLVAYTNELRHIYYRGALDYFCVLEIVDIDGEEVQKPVNLLKATSKLSLQSLKRHIREWHEDAANAHFGEKAIYSYPHLKPFTHQLGLSQFTLLTQNIELYREGRIMHHCVYVSYANSVKAGNYVVFQVERENERATLGIIVAQRDPLNLIYQQCFSYCNGNISPEMRQDVDAFMTHINSQPKDWINLSLVNNEVCIDDMIDEEEYMLHG